MRLKVYQAPNIGAAMAMVRNELGPDALILANRVVDDGVELTVAQELAPPAPAAAPAASEPPPRARVHQPVSPQAIPLPPSEIARAGTLRWHGVPNSLAARLGRGNLAIAVDAEFRFAALPCRAGDPPLLFVGPPGAGKTLTTARLATRLKLAGQTSMVITADGCRAGAAEQLAAFTRLLGLTLIVADHPKQLTRAIARRAADEPVLIDMPGLNPLDPKDRTFLQECQAATGATIAVVLPAGLDPADAGDIATGFKDLGATLLIATRLDQSRRLGGLLAAADAGLTFTDAGVSAAVADGLIRMTPAFLTERLAYAHRLEPTGSPVPECSPSPFALAARVRREQPGSAP